MKLKIEIREIDNGWTVAIEDTDNLQDQGKEFYFPEFEGCLTKLFWLLNDIDKQLKGAI